MALARYEGGYLINKTNLLKPAIHNHTAHLEDPLSDDHLQALNTIQDTPWRVNGFVLDVVREMWLTGIDLGGLPPADDHPLPVDLPDSEWALMDEDSKRAWKRKKAKIYSDNNRLVSKRAKLMRLLDLAERLRDEEAIYFPHDLDFRGRMYPIPQDLNPQGDDTSKALLMFAEGKPLGARGWFWLQVHTANCAGQDKLSLADRVKWCQSNLRMIMQTAEDPLSTVEWWGNTAEFDSPFGFVAAAREMSMAAEFGFDHLSHLPIQVDGSCNGLQHLAALGRDRRGAEATNVAANATRQDIYMEVAKRCEEIAKADALAGNEWAAQWVGHIGRKTVKRAVMTTPYGVTNRGIRDQLVNDKHTHAVIGDEEGHHKLAEYLTTAIARAMDETVASASAIMGYFQAVAGAFAALHVPLLWTTPNGCKIQQAYHNLQQTRLDTICGRVYLNKEGTDLGLAASKQRAGAAPNIIHSFDAAHMAVTVNRAREDYGITAFSMIHDSFGCHACDMDNLSHALRAAFVEIYSKPVLERFHAEQVERALEHGVSELPTPPSLGDFEVSEVMDSEFFFA